jgi:hypothetical protein
MQNETYLETNQQQTTATTIDSTSSSLDHHKKKNNNDEKMLVSERNVVSSLVYVGMHPGKCLEYNIDKILHCSQEMRPSRILWKGLMP